MDWEPDYEHYSSQIGDTITISSRDGVYGEIEIEGISTNYTVGITIEDIEITAVSGGMTTNYLVKRSLPDQKIRMAVETIDLKNNQVYFGEKLKFQQKPSLGTIGFLDKKKVAEQDFWHISEPHPKFAGNIDLKYINPGSTIWLPYGQERRLVVGDAHALMGDGEACGNGVECDAETTITLKKYPNVEIQRPCFRSGDNFFTVGIHHDLETALYTAFQDMAVNVADKYDFSLEKACMLTTVKGDLGVGQIVRENKTAFCKIPREIFSESDFF